MKRSGISIVVAVLMLGGALGAGAEVPAELDSADRVPLHSYDPSAMQLHWAITMAASDCELDAEDLPTEACLLNITDVAGPRGQVNHGSVVSSFVRALKSSGYEGGVGCMVKLIAGSDYGKGDQQVKSGDEAAAESAGESTFAESDTTCGKPDHAGGPDKPGKPEKPGKPDKVHPLGKEKPNNPGRGNR